MRGTTSFSSWSSIAASSCGVLEWPSSRHPSLLSAENTQDVGALLRVANWRAAHPGAGIHRLGIAEVKVELVPGPDLAPGPCVPQHRGIVERRIVGDRPADHADQLRARLLAGIFGKRM